MYFCNNCGPAVLCLLDAETGGPTEIRSVFQLAAERNVPDAIIVVLVGFPREGFRATVTGA
eukprot:2388656-Rhodomonas_salina.2